MCRSFYVFKAFRKSIKGLRYRTLKLCILRQKYATITILPLEPISHLFGYSKWLEWPKIWYNETGGYHTVLVLYLWGAILRHFGPFWSYFKAPEQEFGACLEPILSLFLTCLATQNYLNGPKSGIVGQDITILNWWVPLGAIFWQFLAISEGPVWNLFVIHLAQIWYSGAGYDHTVLYSLIFYFFFNEPFPNPLSHCTRFWAIQVILSSQTSEK